MLYRGRLRLALFLCGVASAATTNAGELPPAESLIRTAPDFRLQQALRLDDAGHRATNFRSTAPGLSWAPTTAMQQFENRQPNAVLKVNDDIRHLVIADLTEKRVYLMENQDGELRVLRHMYATIGKNGTRKQIQDDGRTPVGVYTFTSYLDDDNLPELYGTGAFPLDYPNSWDRKAARTGYGIWVHGIPRDQYSRAPLSSEGCVAVGNEDLISLKPFIEPGQTRVIFSDQLNWLDENERDSQRESVEQVLEAWRLAWNALDTEAYLEFYAADFSTPEMQREQFASNKYRVNAHKQYVHVEIDQLNIFNYPGESELRLVEFRQDYSSDTFVGRDWKQQFWRLDDDGRWRIVQEITTPLS